jgi:hypothetical protein
MSGAFFNYVLSNMFTHIAVPNIIVDVSSKLIKDIKNLPATRDLVTFLSSKVLGGANVGESPVWKSAKMINSSFLFGFSLQICRQFYNNTI